jgi:lysophospholipase L1-like esterase
MRKHLYLFLVALVVDARAVDASPAFSQDSRILFQGDSNTDGNRGRSLDPNHILGHGYAFITAARHGAAFPERKLDFFNRGVSGNTVLDLDKRWAKDTLALKPDLLSVMIGVNDNGKGVPLETYEATYDKILTDARAQNPKLKLVLMEPFVRHPGKPVPEGIVARQAIVAKLAQKHGAALVQLQKLFDDAATKTAVDYWVWVSVHHTYRGHQLMADEWERVVRATWK